MGKDHSNIWKMQRNPDNHYQLTQQLSPMNLNLKIIDNGAQNTKKSDTQCIITHGLSWIHDEYFTEILIEKKHLHNVFIQFFNWWMSRNDRFTCYIVFWNVLLTRLRSTLRGSEIEKSWCTYNFWATKKLWNFTTFNKFLLSIVRFE